MPSHAQDTQTNRAIEGTSRALGESLEGEATACAHSADDSEMGVMLDSRHHHVGGRLE
jgi:hypothetical protein